MQVVDVQPWNDVSVAAWIGPRLRPFETAQAGSVVPSGFPAYARIDNEREGVLPRSVAHVLVQILGAGGEAWLALWAGYGFLRPGDGWKVLFSGPRPPSEPPPAPAAPSWLVPPSPPRRARLLRLPHRDYFLYRGRLDDVPGWMEGPNLWWPDDRSWCVASEIDLPWTYIGGAETLIAAILADPDLGAKPLSLDESTLARDHPELGQRP